MYLNDTGMKHNGMVENRAVHFCVIVFDSGIIPVALPKSFPFSLVYCDLFCRLVMPTRRLHLLSMQHPPTNREYVSFLFTPLYADKINNLLIVDIVYIPHHPKGYELLKFFAKCKSEVK